MADETNPDVPEVPKAPIEPVAGTTVPDATAPVEPAPLAAPVAAPLAAPDGTFAAPPAPAKRKIWPFVLGGGILLFILIVVGLVVAVGSVLGAFGGDPKKTVTDYDLSFKTADCDLFKSTTTTQFQDDFFGKTLDCDRWVENAEGLTVDGEYQYTVKVVISKSDDDTAQVVTNETDTSGGDPVDYTLRYNLTKVDGHWLIESIDNQS